MAVLKPVKAQTVFDEPYGPKESQYGPYYSVTLSVPEGSPGAKYNEDYDRWEAWLIFDAEAQETFDYFMGLARGSEITVVWNGKKYHPVIDDPPPSANGNDARPAQQETQTESSTVGQTSESSQTNNQATQDRTERQNISDKERNYYLINRGREVVDVLESFVLMVRANETFADLSPEEQNRMAITAHIESRKQFGRNPDLQILDFLEEEVKNLDPEDLPGNLLEFIVQTMTGYENTETVREVFRELDIKQNDIDPDDPSTWVQIYRIARRYATYEF